MECKDYASYLSEEGFILDWCDYVEHTEALRRKEVERTEKWIQMTLNLEV